MKRMIDAEKFLDKLLYMGYMDEQKSEVEEVANNMIEEAIPKDQYEARLKADMVAILTEIQLDIQEVNTAPQFLNDDNVKDFSECVDTIIQQKINALRGMNE